MQLNSKYIKIEKKSFKEKKMQTIKFDKKSIDTKSIVHLMPCKISFSGKANVESYFDSSILKSDNQSLFERNKI